MKARRVVVVGLSRLMGDLIARTLGPQSDVEVFDVDEPYPAASRLEADFVIVALDGDELPDSYLDVLEHSPRTRVLALDGDPGHGVLWELRPERRPLGEVSPETLLAAVREPGWRDVRAVG